jgi:integrase
VAALRKSEVVALNVEDVRKHAGGYKLKIRNPKNGRERWAILPESYAPDLTRHLQQVLTGDSPVFTAERTGQRLNTRSLNYIVGRYGDFSPHKYRHRAAETLYQAGASVEDVAKHIGDTIAVTEKVYAGVNIEAQTGTAALLKRKQNKCEYGFETECKDCEYLKHSRACDGYGCSYISCGRVTE